jgi:hypothetical protein
MASRTYRVDFTPNDARSTDAFEITWEIRTEAGGLGVLLADGKATSGSSVTVVVVDNFMTLGFSNTRWIRTLDGAANSNDTSFTVEVVETPPEEVLEGSIIGVGFVFEWRDHRYNFLSDLTPAVETASVMLQNFQPIARTARFRLDPAEFPEGFNPDTDRISIRARFLRSDLVRQYPLGLFALDVGSEEFFATGEPVDADISTDQIATPTRFLEAEGADVCSHLEEEIIEAPYTVAAGTNYVTEVETLIDSVTFTDFTGQSRPLRRDIPATTHVTPSAFTWPPGTSTLQVINDLLAGINYYILYADGQAILRSRERVLPWDDPVSVSYTTLAEPRMIVSPFIRRKIRGQFANQILAVITDPGLSPIETSRANTDTNSLIGTSVSKPNLITIDTPRIVDVDVQESLVDFELARNSAEADRASLMTAFDPRREAREFYSLSIGGVEDETRWMVFGWSLSMATGATMRHDIGRADKLTFEDLTL